MGQYVVFQTEDEIDIKALTTFGVTAKPKTDTPIGYFGTGLKYAIAVLLRNKVPLALWVGDTEYEFYLKEGEFRDQEYQFVMMRKRTHFLKKWHATQLPFTTELGKNWELWQAFRELEANTRDEQGTTTYYPESLGSIPHQICRTIIIVEGEEFAEQYLNRHNTFLPEDDLTLRVKSDAVRVYNKPSDHLYYRGMRVLDLSVPSAFTYNIISRLELTEDRTLKYQFYALSAITELVATSTDKQFIEQVVGLDEDKFWEGKLDFDFMYKTPSQEFLEVVKRRQSSRSRILPRASTYYARYSTDNREEVKEALPPLLPRLEAWVEYGKIPTTVQLYGLVDDLKETIQIIKDCDELMLDDRVVFQPTEETEEEEEEEETEEDLTLEDEEDDIPY